MTDKVKILVVEDEFIVAEDIRGNLARLGYEVQEVARSGEDAISMVKRSIPDVILLDIRLGEGLDGISAAKTIREIADVPIIYVTAHSDKQTFERAKKTEPHAYIVKPFNFNNLHAAIELALFNYSKNVFGHPDELSDSIHDKAPKPDQYVFKDTIFVRMGKAFQKVHFSDICYVRAGGSYSVVHTKSNEFTLSINLHTVQEKLNRPEFFRVHRSYVVNLNNIERIEEASVKIGTALIPVTKKIRDELLSKVDSIS